MNKFKKLALAAISTVMAGTMALSFVACGGGSGGGDGGSGDVGTAVGDLFGVLNEDGSLNYDVYKNRKKVTLNLAIGYEKTITSTSFKDLGGQITLPDGVSYSDGKFKPAWVQMGKDLNIEWKDVYTGSATGSNLGTLKTTKTGNSYIYDTTDIFTTDLSVAVSESAKGTKILNLAKYLDRMPNFGKFLNENGIVYLSLLQDGMNTKTGKGQEILIAPYFDGYNDIERYCIIRHDWAKALLNGTTEGASTTYASACNDVKAQSFMGSQDYVVDALNANGVGTQKVKKNYTAALAAAKDTSTDLGKAYSAIAGGAYSGTSGNIVDIMNAALTANKNATGAKLLDLFRAYIEVAFTSESGTAIYSSTNRADVFIGNNACWDVDDLVAMLRCINTNSSLLGVATIKDKGPNKVGGIAARNGTIDRTPDLLSLACQLYGVRGGNSRNEYTYITKDGAIKDAREDQAMFDAMARFNDLFAEGLIADFSGVEKFTTDSGVGTGDSKGTEYFMVYDYSQTQTKYGFYAEDKSLTGIDLAPNYYFAPIITPVSKWDVDGNGTIDYNSEIFRFTESWRSTKSSGIAVNGAVEKNKDKLDAVLQFIDYLYSDDGQIVSTFGPQASDANGTGGFWYNQKATETEIEDGKYFTYKGEKYSGTDYKGKITPTITKNLYDSFKGLKINGFKLTDSSSVAGAELSFTNYARYLIGSTLPLGVKDQSFENQLTSKMGQTGANRVGKAIDEKVIKGMSLKYNADNYWFTCVPTTLPVSESDQETLDSNTHKNFMYATGTKKDGNKNFISIMGWIILHGTSAQYSQQEVKIEYNSIANLLEATVSGRAFKNIATQRSNAFNRAWTKAKDYWTYLSNIIDTDAE